MKRFLIVLTLTAVTCTAARAQWGDRTHSISFSIGAAPATERQEFFDGWWSDCCDFDRYPWGGLHSLWPGDGTPAHPGRMTTPGALNLTYNYRVLKWLEISATATYTGFYQKSFSPVDGSKIDNLSRHYVYLMPGLDFIWLRRRVVEMYSGFSLGGGFVVSKNNWEPWGSKGFFGGQFTIAGIRIGAGRFFFLSELGYGMKGIATAGMGYRF